MANSRVVLTPVGGSAIVGSLATLLIGFVTLNLLLLVLPVLVLAIVTTEVLAFDWSTRGFGPDRFRWKRFENSSEVGIDGVGSMAIDLEMAGPSAVYAEVFDPPPDAFEVVAGSPRLVTFWRPGVPARVAYVYRPRERGRFRVGPTMIVAHDPFGFAFRMAMLEDRWEVLVTPALSVEEATAIPVVGGRAPAEAYLRRVGPGSEFRSLREYEQSDDARKIAWRKSGVDKLYVRQHEEEAHPEVLVMIDCGRDMRLGRPGSDCLELAVDGGIVVAGQAIGRSDRVSLMVHADQLIEFLAPQRGPTGADALTEAFGRVGLVPRPFDLARALETASERLGVPTTIVLFSTLLSPLGAVEAAVSRLRNRGHRLVVLCPEVASLFPPAPDPLAAETMLFASEPELRAIDSAVDRLRSQEVPVVRYPASEVREFASDVHARLHTQESPL
ncbi:MAG TPA: DUF58 domain-containing protein [Thermoplasmata archaeon]|nr:DUF58 domain-containing protein [Thermoplasmata archaeon]